MAITNTTNSRSLIQKVSLEMPLIIGLFIKIPMTYITGVRLFPRVGASVAVQPPAGREGLVAVHTLVLPFAPTTLPSHVTGSRVSVSAYEGIYFNNTTCSADGSPKGTSAYVLAPPTARRPPAHALKRHQNLGQCSRPVEEGLPPFLSPSAKSSLTHNKVCNSSTRHR